MFLVYAPSLQEVYKVFVSVKWFDPTCRYTVHVHIHFIMYGHRTNPIHSTTSYVLLISSRFGNLPVARVLVKSGTQAVNYQQNVETNLVNPVLTI